MKNYNHFIRLFLSPLLLLTLLLGQVAWGETDQTSSDVVEMDAMTVTDTTGATDLQGKSNSITIITREDIEAASATTVDELLRTAVGLEVWKPQGVFGHASNVRLRGFAHSRATVFLKDGMPIDRFSCGQTIHNAIPLDTVERVEVIRGAAGSVSGKGGMGGVINIVTRKAVGPHAAATYGTYNTRSADVGLGGRLGKRFNLQAGYTHFASDGYFAWNDDWIADRIEAMDQNLLSWNNPAEGWSVKDNYLASLEKQTREMNTVNASLNGRLGERFRFNAGYTWWENNNDIGYQYGYINQLRHRLNLDFENKGLLGGFDLTGNLFAMDETVKFSQPVLPSPDMDAGQGRQTWLTQGNKSDIPLNDYGGMLALSVPISEGHILRLSTGHRYGVLENELYDGLTDETISISQARQYRWGVTLQDTLTLDTMTAQAGIRLRGVKTFDFFFEDRYRYLPYEVDSLSDTQIDPWIGATWEMDDSTTLRASVSRSSTFAPLSYLLGDYERPPGKTIIGNPCLSTEWAINYELGAEKRLGDLAVIQLTAYYNDIRDWMQEVSAADPAYSSISVRWENIEEAVSAGVEIAADMFPTDTLRLYANYTFSHSEVIRFEDKHNNYDNKRLEGNRFPDQAEHKANFGIEWSPPDIARFNLSVRHSGPRYYDVENTVKLSAYTTCDAKIVREFGRHLVLSLEARDIFDVAWEETQMHHTPGRTLFARVTVKY